MREVQHRRREAEVRFVEFRADGGTLEGVAVRYGDTARIGPFSEEFRTGSFAGRFEDVIVNLQHDRGRPVARSGAGLELRDGADALRASIAMPDTSYAREARELVDARILRGLSVEFRVLTEEWRGDHRIINTAELTGLALVDRPAYPESTIAERMRPPAERHEAAAVRRFWY